ncbi:uncharacterized protein LOC127794322 isoform X2 [Diospyros lotus]|uniref:uncharacterized protein LOC127794322 isoform X2 n=1 Tax=Diospyros lotus TaxID=55363 RepID=UPI0022541C2D|nr:uncharacterized protein LOC127794322 isoform X2 [Diospyros lotus]
MAADVVVKHEVSNPCCAALKEKYSKLEASRNALRQGVKIQNELIDKLQNENLSLKKAYEEERVRAEVERKEKAAVQISLENDIDTLKSEIHVLQQGGSQADGVDGGVMILQTCLSELETEKNRLEELFEIERMKVDGERKKAEAEKKEADEVRGILMVEKSRADEERRHADVMQKKFEQTQAQLESLKIEVDEVRSKLGLETLKSKEANKYLEAERKKVIKEKKRADLEKSKAEEQRKLAEINQKKAMDEKSRADSLSQQLEEYRQRTEKLEKEMEELVSLRTLVGDPASLTDKRMNSEQVNRMLKDEQHKTIREKKRADLEMKKAEEQRKIAEVNKKMVMEEKHRADQSAQQLQDNKRQLDELQRDIEVNKKKAMEEKHRADQLARQLKDNKRGLDELKREIEVNKKRAVEEKHRADQLACQLEDNKQRLDELQKEIAKLVSSRVLVEDVNSKSAKLKLLRQQLKLKKKEVKLAKDVAKLEIGRNNILQQELGCLKQDFTCLLQRLNVLNNCFVHPGEGRDAMGKTGNIVNPPDSILTRELFSQEPNEDHLHCNNEFVRSGYTAMDAYDCVKQNAECNAPLRPLSGGNSTQCISGIDSILEPLLRGSNRKMLQSSAIHSSRASFSDRQLMGSQERGAFSVTASAKLTEDKQNQQQKDSNLSCGVTKSRYNENPATVAENSVRSPVSIDVVGRRAGNSKKRKRILDSVRSVEQLYYEGRKWHVRIEEKLSMLHSMLNSQMDKSSHEEKHVVSNEETDIYSEQVKANKKRKLYPEEEVAPQHICHLNEQMDRLQTANKEVDMCDGTCLPANGMGETTESKDGRGDLEKSSEENRSFKELMEGNYMNLLDLDNAGDEECYRRAIEAPLSPTLPVLDFQDSGISKSGDAKYLVDEHFYDGFASGKDNLEPSSSLDVVNVEVVSNKLELNRSETSHVLSACNNVVTYPLKNVVDYKNGGDGTAYDGNACPQQIWESHAELGISDLHNSGYNRQNIMCQSTLGLARDELPKYCVVFSDAENSSSISRIFCATKSFIAQCSMISQTDQVLQKIMAALVKIKDLLPRQKACVLFSFLLHYVSRMALEDLGNFSNPEFISSLDSFSRSLQTVVSDVGTKSIIAELCFCSELLALIEDFLLEGRVLVYGDVSSESCPISGSSVNILLNEIEIILLFRTAPANLLVAGGIVLASICATVGQIGFLCEASYNIFRVRKFDTSLVLTILHVFVYLSGSEYFILEDYSLVMTVIKSLVIFFEKMNLSGNCGYCLQSSGEGQQEFPSCSKCPFSEGAIPMETVVSTLLEKLQSYALSGIIHQGLIESLNSLNPEAGLCDEKIKETFVHEQAFGALSVNYSSSYCVDNSRMFTDIVSLVELVACNMSWEWTCNYILSHLLKLLESHVLEDFSTSAVTLLGKLGRVGVDASGYDDPSVEKLRSSLSAFLYQNSRKLGLPVQIATANALLGLLRLDFEELIKGNAEFPAIRNEFDSVKCIRKWYSTLSSEQQSLSFSLLQPAGF